MTVLVSVIVLIFIVFAIFLNWTSKNAIKEALDELQTSGFEVTQLFKDSMAGFIALSEKSQELVIGLSARIAKGESPKYIQFKDIISCEILFDGVPTFNQAIKAQKIELRIVTKDFTEPNILFQFYPSATTQPKNRAIQEATKWKDIISIIIHKNT